MSTRSFFRWRPVSVILILLTILYAVFTPLNLLLGSVASQRGDQQMARIMYWGAFWNAVVAILCFAGRQMMRRQIQGYFAAGACAVAAALFIVMRTWVNGLLHGRNPFPVLEAILTWLPMLYAIIYALRETKHDHPAQPGTPAAPDSGSASKSDTAGPAQLS